MRIVVNSKKEGVGYVTPAYMARRGERRRRWSSKRFPHVCSGAARIVVSLPAARVFSPRAYWSVFPEGDAFVVEMVFSTCVEERRLVKRTEVTGKGAAQRRVAPPDATCCPVGEARQAPLE